MANYRGYGMQLPSQKEEMEQHEKAVNEELPRLISGVIADLLESGVDLSSQEKKNLRTKGLSINASRLK